MKTIECSQYSNSYGGLSLVKDNNGDYFLEMEDCFGPEYFGPLTDDQHAAFYRLCDVGRAVECSS